MKCYRFFSFFKPFQYLKMYKSFEHSLSFVSLRWHVIASLWSGKIKDFNSKKITKQKRKFLSCLHHVRANCSRNRQAIVHLFIENFCCRNDLWHVHGWKEDTIRCLRWCGEFAHMVLRCIEVKHTQYIYTILFIFTQKF